MPPGRTVAYSLWKKLLVSAFIVFHGVCVLAWVLPKPSDIKTFLLDRRFPLPGRERSADGTLRWNVRWRPVVGTYLFHTSQWQDWSMFAPVPLQVNRYVTAEVHRRDGSREAFGFPRLSQLNMWEAWAEKRYRKYQYRLVDEAGTTAFFDDLARYIARERNDAANPPVRVVITRHEHAIPRHDRPELRPADGKVPWIDYTRRLRDEAVYSSSVLRDYPVPAEDLR